MGIFTGALVGIAIAAFLRSARLRGLASILELKIAETTARALGYGPVEEAVSIASAGDQLHAATRDVCAALRRRAGKCTIIAVLAIVILIAGWAIRIWA